MWKIDLRELDTEKNAAQLKSEIRKYDIVSFDIFDTTIIRMVDDPIKIFSLMEEYAKEVGVTSFCMKRIAAQKQVQAHFGLSMNLDNIYDFLQHENKLPENERNLLQAEEIAMEKRCSIVNETVKDCLNYCREQKKAVIFISDMYLNRDNLAALLADKDVSDYDEIYSSCDVGKNKREGALFDYVAQDMKQKLKRNDIRILHIGDSLRADVFRARMNRHFSSIYMPRIYGSSYEKVRHYGCSLFAPYLRRWAFRDMAPVVWSFCKWIDEKAKKAGADKILFLTREGAFFFPLFNQCALNQYDTDIFYASRRSLLGASSDINWDIIYPYIKNMKVSFLAELFHIPQEVFLSVFLKYDIKLHQDVWEIEKNTVDHVLLDLKDYIFEHAQQQRANLLAYLKQLRIGKTTAVVDIGWKGSSQNYLQRLLDSIGENIHLIGLYFGEFYDSNNQSEKYGYLCSSQDDARKLSVLNAGFVFENILSPQIGSVSAYEMRCGIAHPIVDDASKLNEKILKDTQAGISDFFTKAVFMQQRAGFHVPGEQAVDEMFRTLNSPPMKLAKLLGDVPFKDGDTIRCVALPKHIFHYIVHPKQLLRDIHFCGWNSGFCRRLFKLPLPYFKIYVWVKGLRSRRSFFF